MGVRNSIGHRTNRRPAASGGRRSARGDGLLMLLTRLAQMNVQVHHPGSHQSPTKIDDLSIGPVEGVGPPS